MTLSLHANGSSGIRCKCWVAEPLTGAAREKHERPGAERSGRSESFPKIGLAQAAFAYETSCMNKQLLADNAAANLTRNWARFADMPKKQEVLATADGLAVSADGTAAVRADFAVFVKNLRGTWTRIAHSATGAIGQ